MHMQVYRLPPMPTRNQKLVVHSSKVPIKPKCTSIDLQRPFSSKRSDSASKDSSSCQRTCESALGHPSTTKHLRPDSTKSSSTRAVSIKSNNSTRNIRPTLIHSLPQISARSWVLYQMKKHKCLASKRSFKKRQIASLTKMINLITAIRILEQLSLDAQQICMYVSSQAATMPGTSAQLKTGQLRSLYDLYFAMMLPSGNDAAWQIAQVLGSILIMHRQDQHIDSAIIHSCQSLTNYYQNQPQSISIYLNQMNRTARQIGMYSSYFDNPHGLSNTSSLSTAEDVAKLCIYAMSNTFFRSIVETKLYQKWENTNKLLKQGWSGIKTGITPNAGPCLAASVKKNIAGKQLQFLVVLLKSDSMQARWQQANNLVNWALNNGLSK